MNKVKNLSPCLVQFKTIGSSDLGYITAVQHPDDLPLTVKRVYWTYFTPHNVERGNHVHYNLQQIIVAVSGIIKFKVEGSRGDTSEFILDNPYNLKKLFKLTVDTILAYSNKSLYYIIDLDTLFHLLHSPQA